MELALICPVNYVHMSSLLPGRFCIASIAAKHPNYSDYFCNASAQGYNVVLDNGMFEEDTLTDAQLWQTSDVIQPQVLIAPDEFDSSAKANYERALTFTKARDKHTDVQLMHAIQCMYGDETGFWIALEKTLKEDEFDWVGIGRNTLYNAFGRHTLTRDQSLNAFYFIIELRKTHPRIWNLFKNSNTKIHLLGIGGRVDLLKYFWFVDRMDTASFFWQGSLGRSIQYGTLSEQIKRPRDYFIRDYSERFFTFIESNCRQASIFAQKANELKRQELGGRIKSF